MCLIAPTLDRLVRSHAPLFMYMTDNNDNSGFFIPNKFPPGRPRWAYLAVSGVRLLGTVAPQDVAGFAVV